MSRVRTITRLGLGLGLLSAPACDTVEPNPEPEDLQFRGNGNGNLEPPQINTGSYNDHLEDTVRFNLTPPGSDADLGRQRFGIAADLVTGDDSAALFEGPSQVYGGTVVSNGRTCFSCHRGTPVDFGQPPPPLSDSIPLDDPIFTGLAADAGNDPDGFFNLNELGLHKIRPNRFNVTRPADDPFRQVFGWRKSPPAINMGLSHGFTNDARARTMFETARGAAFGHTQNLDERFDDIFAQADGDGIAAFLFGLTTDPALLALREPGTPAFDALVDDPFATVPIATQEQENGKRHFEKHCFACHNTPNVFGNLSNVEPVGTGERPTSFSPWAPSVARTFNIGISEANFHGLRFTRDNEDGTFSPIVLPLAAEDGTLVNYVVDKDVGLAATTARVDDIGRFKVPTLRNVANHAPYMHDNSLGTLEEVVDYFCSDAYNDSADGQLFPISMNETEKAELVAFLEIL